MLVELGCAVVEAERRLQLREGANEIGTNPTTNSPSLLIHLYSLPRFLPAHLCGVENLKLSRLKADSLGLILFITLQPRIATACHVTCHLKQLQTSHHKYVACSSLIVTR